MTKKLLKAAVGKYSDTAKNYSKDEFPPFLVSEGLSEADAAEVAAEIFHDEVEVEAEDELGNLHYEEWECKISKVPGKDDKPELKIEKLKVSRKCVKITELEANNLNAGVQNGANSYVKMYFLPE